MKKTNKTNVEVKEESKGKRFYKKHRKAIHGIIAGIAVGTLASIVKHHLSSDSEDNSENEESDEEVELTNKQKDAKKIDEQIFTQLAPDIESFVLNDDVDYVEHEETYTYGDIIKDVFVSITTRHE